MRKMMIKHDYTSIKCGGTLFQTHPYHRFVQLDARPTGKARLAVFPTAS